MKLLLLTENWLPETGGIANYLSHLADGLADAGHQVSVVIPKSRRILPKPRQLTIQQYKFFSKTSKPAWFPLYRQLKKTAAKNPWDITLCGKGIFEGLPAYLLNKKFGIPYVIFTYAMEIETWNRKWFNRQKLRKVLTNAALVVYINNQTKKKLIEYGVKESHLLKLQPGVDKKYFETISPESVSSVLKKCSLTKPYILSVGRLIPRKGFADLITAFSKLDQTKFGNYKLVIVGDGPELYNLQSLAEGEWLDTSVIIIPDVTDQHLPALYAGCELFALTPKELSGDIEGFGIVYLEAAAQQKAVVATATGGVGEAVINEKTGIVVQPKDTEAITDALEALLLSDDIRNTLADAAFKRTHQEFTWSSRINILEKALKKMPQNKANS